MSIATLTGDNGVLKQATNAGIKTEHASVLEHLQLEVNSYAIDKNTNVNPITLVGYLQSKGIIGDEIGEGSGKYQINVETLTGKTQKYGNGTATESEKNDVYMLEKVDTSTGNLINKKVASIVPIKLAAKTSDIATYKILYYSTTSEFFNVGNLDNIEETVPSINVVKFTINGTEYQAEKGETWKEWIPKNPDITSASVPEYTLADALQMSYDWSQRATCLWLPRFKYL